MNKKSIFTFILVSISIALMVFVAETRYQHMPDLSRWPRAFGYGFAPWIIGLIPAVLWVAFRRLIKRKYDFRFALLWATLPFSILWVASTALRYGVFLEIQNRSNALDMGGATTVLEEPRELEEHAEGQQARSDAIFLMEYLLDVAGTAAYCNKHIQPSDGLIEATAAWSQYHHADQVMIVAAVEATGGMSRREKDRLDERAMQRIEHDIEAQPDKAAYCQDMEEAIRSGMHDLERNQYTAPALKRVREFQSG